MWQNSLKGPACWSPHGERSVLRLTWTREADENHSARNVWQMLSFEGSELITFYSRNPHVSTHRLVACSATACRLGLRRICCPVLPTPAMSHGWLSARHSCSRRYLPVCICIQGQALLVRFVFLIGLEWRHTCSTGSQSLASRTDIMWFVSERPVWFLSGFQTWWRWHFSSKACVFTK